LAKANTAFASVQLSAGQSVGINTKANGTLSEAGLEQNASTDTKLFAVAFTVTIRGCIAGCAMLEITVVIQGAVEQLQIAVFDKAFGLIVRWPWPVVQYRR